MSDESHGPLTGGLRITGWLLGFIADSGLSAGDRLPSEHELVRRTGAGRSSVREALRILVGRGLVEACPGKGYYLRRPDAPRTERSTPAVLAAEEIHDLMEARIVIEGACAALAASRATQADSARIESFLDAMESRSRSSAAVQRDTLALHLMIAEAAHNRTLYDMLRLIVPKIAAHGTRVAAEIPGQAAIDIVHHRELWAQIRAGDPDAARAAMERHVRDASSLYLLPYEWQALRET